MNRALPLLVFGVCAMMAGVVALTLPETKGEVMKQTVQEGETFMSEHMCEMFPW